MLKKHSLLCNAGITVQFLIVLIPIFQRSVASSLHELLGLLVLPFQVSRGIKSALKAWCTGWPKK